MVNEFVCLRAPDLVRDMRVFTRRALLMRQYAVRVQLVLWFEIVVEASSPEEAIAKAEHLRQICTEGKQLRAETELADPDSAKLSMGSSHRRTRQNVSDQSSTE
jgi:hypothetical protein